VHLEACGHPIVGDKLYGMPEDEAVRYFERRHLTPEAQARLILPRHALHAASLEFEHPFTIERKVFDSGLPADLRGFLEGTHRPEPFAEYEVFAAIDESGPEIALGQRAQSSETSTF
jgi:23S rRNA pseudouridine1911/1915/1917 synthase